MSNENQLAALAANVDFAALRAALKAAAVRSREAKLKLKAAYREFNGQASSWDFTTWKQANKALDAARGDASCAADHATFLCQARAHLRGRLHLTKTRNPDGSFETWTLERQAKVAANILEDYQREGPSSKDAA